MGGVEFAVIAAIIAGVIVLIARIWGGDRRRDRGPYSSGMAARGDFATIGRPSTIRARVRPGKRPLLRASRLAATAECIRTTTAVTGMVTATTRVACMAATMQVAGAGAAKVALATAVVVVVATSPDPA